LALRPLIQQNTVVADRQRNATTHKGLKLLL